MVRCSQGCNTIAAVVLVLCVAVTAQRMDSFGYRMQFSNESGFAYSYDSPFEGTTKWESHLRDDQVIGPIPIGFPFRFYGNLYTSVYVSTNGFISFLQGQPSGCCSGDVIPTTRSPRGIVAGWWEDYDPSNMTNVNAGLFYATRYNATTNVRFFSLHFQEIPHYNGPPASFEFKLFENSSNIEVHLLRAPASVFQGEHTCGIKSPDGLVGLQALRTIHGLPDQFAVRFVAPVYVPPVTTGRATTSGGVSGSSTANPSSSAGSSGSSSGVPGAATTGGVLTGSPVDDSSGGSGSALVVAIVVVLLIAVIVSVTALVVWWLIRSGRLRMGDGEGTSMPARGPYQD
jgi:hypothetical protein